MAESSTEELPAVPQERFARTWVAALALVFTAYFVAVALQGDASFLEQVSLLGAALGTLGVVALVATFGPLRRTDQAEISNDERDRSIESRASASAYRVLIGGMILVGCVLPFSRSGWDIVNPALAVIALSEIVHHGLVAWAYRRGGS